MNEVKRQLLKELTEARERYSNAMSESDSERALSDIEQINSDLDSLEEQE